MRKVKNLETNWIKIMDKKAKILFSDCQIYSFTFRRRESRVSLKIESDYLFYNSN